MGDQEMILVNKKIIFFHIPKCAGKSVEIFFTGAAMSNPHNIDWSLREFVIKGNYKEFYKFVIIRNPLDRILSVYNHYRNGGMGSTSDIEIGAALKNVDINNFVNNINNYRGGMISHHMLGPQHRWIFDGEKKIVDDILLFEDLPDNVIKIGRRYGVINDFPHLNKSKRFASVEDLSGASLNILRDHYKRDFEIIGKDI